MALSNLYNARKSQCVGAYPEDGTHDSPDGGPGALNTASDRYSILRELGRGATASDWLVGNGAAGDLVALECLHDRPGAAARREYQGLVHGDPGPANVRVTPAGVPEPMDSGRSAAPGEPLGPLLEAPLTGRDAEFA